MIFMHVQIGNHTGNGSSSGGHETSDDDEEEGPAPRPETKSRTNEGNNKRQRTGIPDQSKEYFGVAMEKIVSSAVSSAINSTGVDRNRERDYVQMEQQRRERAESQLREFELKQKLSDQRSAVEVEVAKKYQTGIGEASAKLCRVEDELEQQRKLTLIETTKTAAAEREQRRIAEEVRESIL